MTHNDTIDSQLLDLMLRAGSRWVLWLLILLSLAAVAVMIDRVWFFLRERPPRDRLAAAIRAMRSGDAPGALAKLAGARSMEAAVVRTCLAHAADGADAVEDHKAAAIETERLRYENRLAFLGTLGNNAPFVGLFGTVLGVINAFQYLAQKSASAEQETLSTIAEALSATALGLLVAIPAVIAFNFFSRKVRVIMGGADEVAHAVLSLVHGAAHEGAAKEPADGGR
jgi:biopolymer transport protein ExbB